MNGGLAVSGIGAGAVTPDHTVYPPSQKQPPFAFCKRRRVLVPLTGVEPVRYFYRGILSPLCLPIPPQRHIWQCPMSSEHRLDYYITVIKKCQL